MLSQKNVALILMAIGTALAMKLGPTVFKITAASIRPDYSIFFWAIVAAPVFSAIATFIPTIYAVLQDPAITLRED